MRKFMIFTLLLLASLTGCLEQDDTELAVCEQQGWDLFVENEKLRSELDIADELVRVLENEKVTRENKVVINSHVLEQEMNSGIEQVNEYHYRVDHDLYVKYGLNKDILRLFGRAIPHRAINGEIDGLRLSGIRRFTPGERLGLRNGDILVALDSKNYRSYSSFWSSMSDIEYISSTNIVVIRRGERITIRYDFTN